MRPTIKQILHKEDLGNLHMAFKLWQYKPFIGISALAKLTVKSLKELIYVQVTRPVPRPSAVLVKAESEPYS